MANLVEKVHAELTAKHYPVRLNHRKTHVQFQVCPFCGNDRWNFDVELEERFVFNCWACWKSGASAVYLQKLGIFTRIPMPSGEYRPIPTKKTEVFFNYPFFPKDHFDTPLKFAKDLTLKGIHEKRPVSYGDTIVRDGFMLLGRLGKGVLIANRETHAVRKTASDLFVYSPGGDSRTLAVVESFFDILPFFHTTPTLVLGGTNLPKWLLEAAAQELQPKRLIVALDQGAEKPFVSAIPAYFGAPETFVMTPQKHSPAESQYLALKRIL